MDESDVRQIRLWIGFMVIDLIENHNFSYVLLGYLQSDTSEGEFVITRFTVEIATIFPSNNSSAQLGFIACNLLLTLKMRTCPFLMSHFRVVMLHHDSKHWISLIVVLVIYLLLQIQETKACTKSLV